MIDWIAFSLSAIGSIVIAQGRPELMKYGLFIHLISGILWMYYTYTMGLSSIFLTNLMFFVIELKGFLTWRKIK